MKIHNKLYFFQGMGCLVCAGLYGYLAVSRGKGFDWTLSILWGVSALIYLCFSTDGKLAAQAKLFQQRLRSDARQRFGAGAAVVLNLGWAAMAAALLFCLLVPRCTGLWIFLLGAGCFYQLLLSVSEL